MPFFVSTLLEKKGPACRSSPSFSCLPDMASASMFSKPGLPWLSCCCLLASLLVFHVEAVNPTCAPDFDPSRPCSHTCCLTGSFSTNQCIIDATAPDGYRCECGASYVSTNNNTECSCSQQCSAGTQSADCKTCSCPPSFTCLGNKCSRAYDPSDSGWTDSFQLGCSTCNCRYIECRPEESGAWPDNLGYCRCPSDTAETANCEKNKCVAGGKGYGRFFRLFYPDCETCRCQEVMPSCTSSNPLALSSLQSDWVFHGELNCATDDTEPFTLTDFQFANGILTATLYSLINSRVAAWQLTSSLAVDATGCASLDEATGFFINPNLPSYSAVGIRGQFVNEGGHPMFVGTIPECRKKAVTATLADPCSSDTYRDFRGICTPLTTCAPGGYVSSAPTPTTNRACNSCQLGSFSTTENAPACEGWTNCPPGSYQQAVGTSSSDRQCSPCESGTFSTTVNAAECADHSSCPPGVAEFEAPTSSSDRICSNCDGVLFYQDQPNEQGCKTVGRCFPGTYESAEPTITSDRVCMQCDSGKYQTQPDETECLTPTNCLPGTYVLKAPTSTSNRACAACDGQFGYQDEVNGASCKTIHNCAAGQQEGDAPTPARDRVCIDCVLGRTFKPTAGNMERCANVTICPPGQQQFVAPTRTSDRECQNCPSDTYKATSGNGPCIISPKCPAGSYETTALTLTSARQCSACPSGTFRRYGDGEHCQAWTTCQSDEYETVQPDPSTDRACQHLTACESDEWEFSAPTPTTDRVCLTCTVCPPSHAEIVSCSNTADTQCRECRACSSGYYLTTLCTATFDGECGPCTQCQATEYETRPCRNSLNRLCAPITECVPGQYEYEPPSETKDRICRPLTQCYPDTEFEQSPPTATTDRVCAAVSDVCTEGYEQTQEPTATTDRMCRACAAGQTDDDRDPLTPCVDCLPGAYTPAESEGTCDNFLCLPGTHDHDANPATQCQPCATGTFQPDAGRTTCNMWTLCPPGTEEVPGVKSAISNRKCQPCEEGVTYSDESTGDEPCKPVTVCGPGFRQVQTPTTTSDRVCEQCPSGYFKSQAGVATCKPVRLCRAGEEESVPPTSSTDRVCEWCQAGVTYQPHANSTSPCLPVTICLAGSEQRSAPTFSTDRRCQSCLLGETFKPNDGDGSCQLVKTCQVAEEQSVAPTTSTDRECKPCQLGETYKDVVGQFPCRNTTQCGRGLYLVTSPTRSTDRVCQPCPEGQYKDSDLNYEVCKPQSPPCSQGTYQARAPTTSSDRVCSGIHQCADNEFEYRPATATSDTVCQTCRTCPANHVQTGPCTKTSDTECEGCSTCAAGYFVKTACTLEMDTACQPCSQCNLEREYIFQECAGSHDLVCAPRTNCSVTEYDAQEPGSIFDAICTPLTECTLEQFELYPPTATSDRICKLGTECQPGTELEKEMTRTSDRVCTPCPRGFADHDLDPATPCQPCAAGTYSNPDQYGRCEPCVVGTHDHDADPRTRCVPCGRDYYQNDVAQVTCKKATTCGAGYEEAMLPTNSTDRVCDECKQGFFKSSVGQSEHCKAHAICAPGFGLVSLGTAIRDTICLPCAPGFWKDVYELSTCHDVTTCMVGEEEFAAPTTTSDRVCVPCPLGTFKSSPGEGRQCQPWLECQASTQFEETPPSRTTDRICADLVVCTKTEYEASPPTPTSDRVCEERSRLQGFRLWLQAVFAELAATPEDRSALGQAVIAGLKSVIPMLRGYIDVEFEENSVLEPGLIVANVSVTSSSIRQQVKAAGDFIINLDNTQIHAELYTEDEAIAAAQSAYEANISQGEEAAVLAARQAYIEASGMRNFTEAWPSIAPSSATEQVETDYRYTVAIVAIAVLMVVSAVYMFAFITCRMKRQGYFALKQQKLGSQAFPQEFSNPTFRDIMEASS
eukprot:m.154233 g.154233  ORF g.154233 m.154233 type:complete len:1890 (-) comp16251_c2_seq2:273-5942(-)